MAKVFQPKISFHDSKTGAISSVTIDDATLNSIESPGKVELKFDYNNLKDVDSDGTVMFVDREDVLNTISGVTNFEVFFKKPKILNPDYNYTGFIGNVESSPFEVIEPGWSHVKTVWTVSAYSDFNDQGKSISNIVLEVNSGDLTKGFIGNIPTVDPMYLRCEYFGRSSTGRESSLTSDLRVVVRDNPILVDIENIKYALSSKRISRGIVSFKKMAKELGWISDVGDYNVDIENRFLAFLNKNIMHNIDFIAPSTASDCSRIDVPMSLTEDQGSNKIEFKNGEISLTTTGGSVVFAANQPDPFIVDDVEGGWFTYKVYAFKYVNPITDNLTGDFLESGYYFIVDKNDLNTSDDSIFFDRTISAIGEFNIGGSVTQVNSQLDRNVAVMTEWYAFPDRTNLDVFGVEILDSNGDKFNYRTLINKSTEKVKVKVNNPNIVDIELRCASTKSLNNMFVPSENHTPYDTVKMLKEFNVRTELNPTYSSGVTESGVVFGGDTEIGYLEITLITNTSRKKLYVTCLLGEELKLDLINPNDVAYVVTCDGTMKLVKGKIDGNNLITVGNAWCQNSKRVYFNGFVVKLPVDSNFRKVYGDNYRILGKAKYNIDRSEELFLSGRHISSSTVPDIIRNGLNYVSENWFYFPLMTSIPAGQLPINHGPERMFNNYNNGYKLYKFKGSGNSASNFIYEISMSIEEFGGISRSNWCIYVGSNMNGYLFVDEITTKKTDGSIKVHYRSGVSGANVNDTTLDQNTSLNLPRVNFLTDDEKLTSMDVLLKFKSKCSECGGYHDKKGSMDFRIKYIGDMNVQEYVKSSVNKTVDYSSRIMVNSSTNEVKPYGNGRDSMSDIVEPTERPSKGAKNSELSRISGILSSNKCKVEFGDVIGGGGFVNSPLSDFSSSDIDGIIFNGVEYSDVEFSWKRECKNWRKYLVIQPNNVSIERTVDVDKIFQEIEKTGVDVCSFVVKISDFTSQDLANLMGKQLYVEFPASRRMFFSSWDRSPTLLDISSLYNGGSGGIDLLRITFNEQSGYSIIGNNGYNYGNLTGDSFGVVMIAIIVDTTGIEHGLSYRCGEIVELTETIFIKCSRNPSGGYKPYDSSINSFFPNSQRDFVVHVTSDDLKRVLCLDNLPPDLNTFIVGVDVKIGVLDYLVCETSPSFRIDRKQYPALDSSYLLNIPKPHSSGRVTLKRYSLNIVDNGANLLNLKDLVEGDIYNWVGGVMSIGAIGRETIADRIVVTSEEIQYYLGDYCVFTTHPLEFTGGLIAGVDVDTNNMVYCFVHFIGSSLPSWNILGGIFAHTNVHDAQSGIVPIGLTGKAYQLDLGKPIRLRVYTGDGSSLALYITSSGSSGYTEGYYDTRDANVCVNVSSEFRRDVVVGHELGNNLEDYKAKTIIYASERLGITQHIPFSMSIRDFYRFIYNRVPESDDVVIRALGEAFKYTTTSLTSPGNRPVIYIPGENVPYMITNKPIRFGSNDSNYCRYVDEKPPIDVFYVGNLNIIDLRITWNEFFVSKEKVLEIRNTYPSFTPMGYVQYVPNVNCGYYQR